MTDRCAPPYEHANERWHWLKIHDNAVVRFWWPGDGWHQPLGNIGSNDMARAGYRYLRPCRPDDAEARERLEQENKRLREALDQTLATGAEVANGREVNFVRCAPRAHEPPCGKIVAPS